MLVRNETDIMATMTRGISKLVIAALKEELKARGLILGGNKPDIIAGLNNYLDSTNNNNKY